MRTLLIGILAVGLLSPQIIVIAKKKAGGTTYIVEETFEGSNLCDTGYTSNCLHNNWSDTAGSTVVFDYATSPGPISGSNSVSVIDTGTAITSEFSGHTSGTIYITTKVIPVQTGVNHTNTVGVFAVTTGDLLARIRFQVSGGNYTTRLYHSGVSTFSTCATGIAAGELWYLKLAYTPGTGANAVWTYYAVKDSAGFPGWGSAICSVTTASDTQLVGKVGVASAAAVRTLFDDIRVSLSDISY